MSGTLGLWLLMNETATHADGSRVSLPDYTAPGIDQQPHFHQDTSRLFFSLFAVVAFQTVWFLFPSLAAQVLLAGASMLGVAGAALDSANRRGVAAASIHLTLLLTVSIVAADCRWVSGVEADAFVAALEAQQPEQAWARCVAPSKRRRSLWLAGSVAVSPRPIAPGKALVVVRPRVIDMSPLVELAVADLPWHAISSLGRDARFGTCIRMNVDDLHYEEGISPFSFLGFLRRRGVVFRADAEGEPQVLSSANGAGESFSGHLISRLGDSDGLAV
ncbi:MAG: hypothetical protein KDD44_05450, partial [Bdellovibrionales bacterium]|nr:hypothetical protein [Bdellovibrionales bacterium]